MAAKKNVQVSRRIIAKAREVLTFAEDRADQAADWLELHHALFGLDGQATTAFPTEAERTAFSKTEEFKQLLALMDRLCPEFLPTLAVYGVSGSGNMFTLPAPGSAFDAKSAMSAHGGDLLSMGVLV